MAVYTDVAAEELAEFLSGYDIGELLSYKGIAEGVENSNFLLHTTAGSFFLTLYEKRVAVKDLPFFLGADGASRRARHRLPATGQRTATAKRSARSPAGPRRSSTFSKACGRASRTPRIAPASARRWRRCIWPGATFRCRARTRCRFRAGGRCSIRPRRAPTACSTACAIHRARTRSSRSGAGRRICRKASSTPTCFPTMCCFSATSCPA